MSKSTSAPRRLLVAENLTRKSIIAAHIESAQDSRARRRGLLDARSLDLDSGLWLNPCEAIHTFGMKIPLDVIFLDAELYVRKITANLKPNRISFCLLATSVLEIKAGAALAAGLECGDQLRLRAAGGHTVSKEHAQNGPAEAADSDGSCTRLAARPWALCALMEHAQNGPAEAASIYGFLMRSVARLGALCALREHAQNGPAEAAGSDGSCTRLAARPWALCASDGLNP